MEERLGFLASTFAEVSERLRAYLAGDHDSRFYRGTVVQRQNQNDQHSTRAALEDLTRAWVFGAEVDWSTLYQGDVPRRLPLPVYPFAKERCWVQPAIQRSTQSSSGGKGDSATQLPVIDGKVVAVRLTPDLPFLRNHQIDGVPVLPAAAALGLMVNAVRRVSSNETAELNQVVWLRPLIVREETEVRIRFRTENSITRIETIGDDETVYVSGSVSFGTAFAPALIDLAALKGRCDRCISAQDLYDRFARGGLLYGDQFQIVEAIWHNSQEALSCLGDGPWETEISELALPVNLLDAAFQSIAALHPTDGKSLPFSMGHLRFDRVDSPG
jgi:acyl transferase domain-containing protein